MVHRYTRDCWLAPLTNTRSLSHNGYVGCESDFAGSGTDFSFNEDERAADAESPLYHLPLRCGHPMHPQ